jgi:uncharacterized membrane protein YraQ (UPF0718 family)
MSNKQELLWSEFWKIFNTSHDPNTVDNLQSQFCISRMTPHSVDGEPELRKRIAEILRNGITFSGQVGDYVIHGAIDELIKLIGREGSAPQEPSNA